MHCLVLSLFCLVTATEAVADRFVPVTQREEFLNLLGARELEHPLLSIRLAVTPDGRISGQALGWPVSGSWNWEGGYFCRQMDWSGTPIPFNCQLVEAVGQKKLRFTTDQGAGDAATFRIK